MNRRFSLIVFSWFTVAAGGLSSAGDRVDYLTQIKPILAAKCYSCHGALQQEAELRLETRPLMLEGGDSGQVIVPGNAAESLLLQRISAESDERMPPPEQGAALKADAIALIRKWIDGGAETPPEEIPVAPREHWSFQRIEKPAFPATGPRALPSANPIDLFLEAKRAPQSLKAQPEAERSILIRRLYLDLIGLPPSREQLRDQRPWEDIVDELLESPHHGQRWARHWMDVWRYSDWYGLGSQLRNSQKHLWHWRDWIVESLNADKGYDRMILEMLAGDEIAPDDPDVVRATGFLARNYYLFNRTTWLDSTIEHTGKAFLGLTLNCAKCHDHKYDPISHVDYYRFRAIFEPHQVRLDPVPGVTDFERDGLPRVFDDHLDIQTFLHRRGDPQNPDPDTKITPGVPAIFTSFAPQIEPVQLPLDAYAPGVRDYVQQDRLREALATVQAARGELDAAKKTLAVLPVPDSKSVGAASSQTAEDVESAVNTAAAKLAAKEAAAASLEAVIAADNSNYRRDADAGTWQTLITTAAKLEAESMKAAAEYELLAHAGDAGKVNIASERLKTANEKLACIQTGKAEYTSIRGAKKALESPADNEADYPVAYPETSTGRRLALAKWITSRENPLAARVAVNHVWMRHFGEPLVESVFDFGLRAKRPLHAELLEYLAAEFMETGWRFRHLHRLIVTSKAYRLSSSGAAADPATLAADPTNRFYWRMNSRRMESQIVRDSLLQLAGTLDPRLGGPSLDPGDSNTRRSLYFKHSRDQQDKFLSMFDDADLLQCYRRSESIVPQQALALTNSELSIEMAESIAGKLFAENNEPDRDTFIETVFETLLGRLPDDAERDECRTFCREMAHLLASSGSDAPESRIRTRLVQALLNHNDFISIR